MIVTLTANPSLDRALRLEAPLLAGEVQPAAIEREDAGGKGINVARVIRAAGVEALAVLPLAADDPYSAALRATGVPSRPVPIRGHARANLTIADPEGVTTKLNLPGAALTVDEADALVRAVVEASEGADWLVLAGSLPPGVPDDFYAGVIAAVRERWGGDAPKIAVDTSGEALRAVVESSRPELIKPNEDELADLAGVVFDPAEDLRDEVLSVARALVPDRVGAALVTLGALGSVLVTGDGGYSATAPRIRVQSTVGAGDSALAGYLLAEIAGEAPAGRLERAIRYGSAAASLPGTQPPHPSDLPVAAVPVASLQP